MNTIAPLRLFFFVTLWPLACLATPAPLPADAPTLDTIIATTLARDGARQQALQTMQYDQTAAVEQLDGNGGVAHRDILQMIVRPGANPPWQVLTMNGATSSLTAFQADEQAKGQDVESNKQTFTLHDLVARFTVELTGMEPIDGQPAYVLAFTPKPDQPYRDDTEKVVNQLQGHMWISARTYNVLQTEASLAHPVSVAWFFASVPTLDFHYHAQDSDAGFAPAQVRITLKVNAPFVGFYERQTIDMTNFRSRSTAGAAAQTAAGVAYASGP